MGWKVQAKRNEQLRSGKFAATWRGVEWEGEAR